MFFSGDRKTLKQARDVLRGGRKWLRIHRDLLSARQVSDLEAKLAELQRAVRAGAAKETVRPVDQFEAMINQALPPRRHPGLRENVEVFLVAAIVAMAVRTFVVQPFKIPTGSMQPTLYGIHPGENCGSRSGPLHQVIDLVLFGTTHRGGRCTVRGDFIFVDKISYHFRKPQRGEVIVFDTARIRQMPPDSRGKFYIKRLIAIGGDKVRIAPPHVVVNGEVLDERPAFRRIYSGQDGYHGYVIPPASAQSPAPALGDPDEDYLVPAAHFLPMGDNSRNSFDGRYWGAVPDESLVGRAILVYWPFSRRFGWID